jgi:predicted RNA-binding protein with PIN domain
MTGRPTMIVDGTNVSWAWARSRPLMVQQSFGAAQLLLVQTALESPLRATYQGLIFVFDGPPCPGGPSSGEGARVLHPDIGHSADDRILEVLAQRHHGGVAMVLVTSDRALRDAARALGATTKGAMEMINQLEPKSHATAPSSSADPFGLHQKPSPSRHDTDSWLLRFGVRKSRDAGGQKEGDSR